MSLARFVRFANNDDDGCGAAGDLVDDVNLSCQWTSAPAPSPPNHMRLCNYQWPYTLNVGLGFGTLNPQPEGSGVLGFNIPERCFC